MDHARAGWWVIVVSIDQAHLAANLRRLDDVEVLVTESEVWLRGPIARLQSRARGPHQLHRGVNVVRRESNTSIFRDSGIDGDEQLEKRLLRLVPGIRPHMIGSKNELTSVGELVPSNWLPDGIWIPLNDWLRVEFPMATRCWKGSVEPVAISLVRCLDEQAPNLLVTQLTWLEKFVTNAPAWRLERLAFAADKSGRVIVRGTPLLPVQGEQWVERDGIATRAGWTWAPAIDTKILRRKFELHDGDLALLDHSQWYRISEANWVRLTRSAVRSTVETTRGS